MLNKYNFKMACNRNDLSKIGSSLTNHKTKLPKCSEPIIVLSHIMAVNYVSMSL